MASYGPTMALGIAAGGAVPAPLIHDDLDLWDAWSVLGDVGGRAVPGAQPLANGEAPGDQAGDGGQEEDEQDQGQCRPPRPVDGGLERLAGVPEDLR